ncbi:OCIA domain-containing protein 2-like isoform X1 [Denticeps clupeoides]|uniref:OCIA domain-containing protein n=1 Tax=Denticeps clupeoides TaxID=299321 RepID=A0AAY4C8Y9_9TELE|nr:OCIA domain-containing protein 2-like isoform X1 [Denticeps clupeoides]XP_028844775.1 OCIA domain-containing protein 2-like isoform X1 [Denticeps clupeoides]
MSSEATEGSVAVESKEAAPGSQKKCGKGHIQREEVRKIWRECQEESFWYRALPLSLGSMTVTGALIYQGVWKTSVRFGPFPKLALAGIVGFAVGKASYLSTCREKFQKLGPDFPFGSGFRPHCHHVCEKCKEQGVQVPPAQPSN